MILSIILDKAGRILICLKSFTPFALSVFGTGVTIPFFQALGNSPSRKAELTMFAIKGRRTTALEIGWAIRQCQPNSFSSLREPYIYMSSQAIRKKPKSASGILL